MTHYNEDSSLAYLFKVTIYVNGIADSSKNVMAFDDVTARETATRDFPYEIDYCVVAMIGEVDLLAPEIKAP